MKTKKLKECKRKNKDLDNMKVKTQTNVETIQEQISELSVQRLYNGMEKILIHIPIIKKKNKN